MGNDWQRVWQKRQLPADGRSLLASLIAADGFDGMGAVEEQAWRSYAAAIRERLALGPGDRVFEVGCGAGAFLYPFWEWGHRVGGIDYAANLIDVARRAMPEGDFVCQDASQMDTLPGAELVLSNAVFYYLTDADHAERVLNRMIERSHKWVVILDVADRAHYDLAMRLRRGSIGEAAYAERYRGLDHLYLERAWFYDRLRAAGAEVKIEDQAIAGYLHSGYRFNVFARIG